MTRYIVVNENTLAYTYDYALCWLGWVGVLAGSAVRGGHNPLNGPTVLSMQDVVRDATLRDFEAYRVMPPRGLFDAPSAVGPV